MSVSVQRIFCDAKIAQDVAEGIAAQADSMKVSDPTLADTDVGPLINHNECDRVATWVSDAISGGAKLITGGDKISDSCYKPTVLFDPPADAKISTAEIFGPAVCVYPFDNLDSAQTVYLLASKRPYSRVTWILLCIATGTLTALQLWLMTIQLFALTGCHLPVLALLVMVLAVFHTLSTKCKLKR